MAEVNGKQFPSVWSDLFIEFETGKVDGNASIKISDVPEWVREYSQLDETYDYKEVEDLYKRGAELNCYLGAVYARVKGMYDQYKITFTVRMATIKSTYTTPDAKAESTKDRMILVESEYSDMNSLLVRMDTMVNYTDALMKSMKPILEGLQIRLRKEAKDQPQPPLARQ